MIFGSPCISVSVVSALGISLGNSSRSLSCAELMSEKMEAVRLQCQNMVVTQ